MAIEVLRPRLNSAWLTGLCAISAAMMAASPVTGQWTAIRLHDPANTSSEIRAVFGSQASGVVVSPSAPSPRPALWSSYASPTILLGEVSGEVYAMDSVRQVGRHQGGASIWTGTPKSRVSLHPSGATGASVAYGIAGDQQVGRSGWGTPLPGNDHASLWRGTAASFIDLHPAGADRSIAYATDGTLQGGMAEVPGTHAALWSGSAASFVDLNPGVGYHSTILGMVPGQQVGWASTATGTQHASIWSGTISSWIDIHPFPGFGSSILNATTGQVQAGYSAVPGSGVPHAGVWYGTAGSFVDLHQFLPPGYFSSGAFAIYQDASGIVIGGNAVSSMTGRAEAFIWTTVPVPSSALLLTFGVFASRRRRP